MTNEINFFKNKKILIIVPHEDDELNLVGGLLGSDFFDKTKVYVVYMTNGDYLFNIKTRFNEAISSLKKCGIKRENIIFLGYPDQHYSENDHIYMTSKPNVFVSNRNKSETYFFNGEAEYSMNRNGIHLPFNKESLIDNLKNLIIDYEPDIVFVNDFDSHPDHRCLSLCFDYAMGKVIKELDDFRPIIFKGFCYPTSYSGISDYDNINLLSTSFNKEEFNKFRYQNPYYKWNSRVRFKTGKKCFNYLLLNNKLYKCLKTHKSQLLIRKYKSIINSDQIFWQKATNNLCLKANISVSSGNSKMLNDFITYDCSNIMHKDRAYPTYKNVSWIPDINDNQPYIMINFNDPTTVSIINFYQNTLSDNNIIRIRLEFDDGVTERYCLDNCKFSSLKLKHHNSINWLKIVVEEREGVNAGFSEIEILPPISYNNKFINLLIDDNFVNEKYFLDGCKHKLSVYCYNGLNGMILDPTLYSCFINEKKIQGDEIRLYKNSTMRVVLNDDPSVCDEVKLKKINLLNKVLFIFTKIINKIIFVIDEFIIRIENKLRKILGKL